MEIIWKYNFLETIGFICLGLLVLRILIPIVGTVFLNGKFKGWW
jgi:hypothetical protein